jgi:hypothetical protein
MTMTMTDALGGEVAATAAAMERFSTHLRAEPPAPGERAGMAAEVDWLADRAFSIASRVPLLYRARMRASALQLRETAEHLRGRQLRPASGT